MNIARTRAQLASWRAMPEEPLPDCLLAWQILDNYDEKRERLQYHLHYEYDQTRPQTLGGGAYGKIKSSRDALSANAAGDRQAPLDRGEAPGDFGRHA